MRILLVLAGLASLAALTVSVEEALGPAAVTGAGAGHLPVGALFTFAVAAFRSPLR